MKKRDFVKSMAGIAVIMTVAMMVIVPASALADWNPRRPINMIVPYKAGGGTDSFGRAISASTKGILKVPIVIVNKPGYLVNARFKITLDSTYDAMIKFSIQGMPINHRKYVTWINQPINIFQANQCFIK